MIEPTQSPPGANDEPMRPGWPEIIVGLLVLIVVGFFGGALIAQLPIGQIAIGLILSALSGISGVAAFVCAYSLRIRSWASFGVRKTSLRWLMIGVGVGVIAFILKSLAILAYISLTGDTGSPQEIYATGASGGIATVLVATFFLSVITPIGEELLFRGVITSALARYGRFIAIGGGALLFAIFHGINVVFPAAFVVGIAAGEVFLRSRSIWPAVVVHVVVNLPTIPLMVLANAGH